MIDNILVSVWWTDKKIHIWNVEKGELLQMIDTHEQNVQCVRVSGDGSKIFSLGSASIRAWSVSTGEAMDYIWCGFSVWGGSLTVDDSRVWVWFPESEPRGWDFGIPGSSPVSLSNPPLSRPCLDSIVGTKQQNLRIKDTMTGKEVLQLYGRFGAPVDAWWDGQYLVAGYASGEVLILDFVHVLPLTGL